MSDEQLVMSNRNRFFYSSLITHHSSLITHHSSLFDRFFTVGRFVQQDRIAALR
jgi:hypothetical protein